MFYRMIMARPESGKSGWAGTEESSMREEEARFLVIELVKQEPALTSLLFSLQTSGEPWSNILATLNKTVGTPR
jgi:hypothetical protein